PSVFRPRTVSETLFGHLFFFGGVELGEFPRQPAAFLPFGQQVDRRLQGPAGVGIPALPNPKVKVGDRLLVERHCNFRNHTDSLTNCPTRGKGGQIVSCKLLLSSSTYVIFLVAIFLLYWPLARVRALALSVVLLANYFFYAKWDLYYLALIPVVSSCDFAIGLGLQESKNPRVRRLLVTTSIAMNIGLLAGLKSVPFFVDMWA